MKRRMRTIAMTFVVIVTLIGGAFLMSYHKKVYIFADKADAAVSEDRISFLVLGRTGHAIGWSNAPDLTDSMMIVDYHPKTGAANLVSLPRDLYVTLGGESFKLNEVMRRGKLNDLLAELPDMTGIKTDRYIVVDVDTLKGVVDGLGGVDLTLKADVVDAVSGYRIKEGENHIDGTQAVWLARNRNAPEGDFTREGNQQEVIRAILKKFRAMGSFEKAAFMFKMVPELARLDANIDFQELLPLADKFGKVKLNNIVVDFKTGILESSYIPVSNGDQYVLVPRAGQGNYGELREFIRSKIEQ